jgi:hypothetical protein
MHFDCAANAEQPLDDTGHTGIFMRSRRHEEMTETFAFTAVDGQWSFGGLLSGLHRGRINDQLNLEY